MSSSAARTLSHASRAHASRAGRPAAIVSSFPYDELSPAVDTGTSDATLPTETSQVAAAGESRERQLGREEGRGEARKTFDEQLANERSAIAAALAQFTRERGVYYARVETEVVHLALAIARKILHREAQVDPLLLAGIVRVALEKIEGVSGVRLHVHPQVATDWQRYLASRMEPGDLPEIVEDPALEPERCVLQTSTGTAQLGIELQLKEIEQGFMDLLAARPQENS